MPRKPRMYIRDIPTHIVQRGNNKEPCFFSEDDCLYYLDKLGRALIRYKVKLHAYILMTNYVHLLMTPSDEHGISKVMSMLGQYYVQYVNNTYRRSGTIWEGRHKASLINADEYLLICYRYIELAPVRAGLTDSAVYPWSSYSHHAWSKTNKLITDHEVYMNLGSTEDERSCAYRELFKNGPTKKEIDMIDNSINHNYPLGDERFKERIETTLKNRKIGFAKRGRPTSRLINKEWST